MEKGEHGPGVYFIVTEDERFVKIGYSEHVITRFEQIRTIGPGTSNASLAGYLPGSRATESWLHDRFQAYRDVGEWFHYSEELKDFARRFLTPVADFTRKVWRIDAQISNVMREFNRRRRTFGGPPRKTFHCRYCGEAVVGRRQVRAHETVCSKRPQSKMGRPPKISRCVRCGGVFPSYTILVAHECRRSADQSTHSTEGAQQEK